MEIQDRSPIAEQIIFQLWDKGYFASLELTTHDDHLLKIISQGQRNFDSGPDFKNIAIKLNERIYQGDLEIHRSVNDWYLHKHHHDSAYNRVILHLVIGKKEKIQPVLRLNQRPVMAQVFVEINEQQLHYLSRKYHLHEQPEKQLIKCKYSDEDPDNRLRIIEEAGLTRLWLKAYRFNEERQQNSWDQILYMGIMEALGFSKNQRPFKKLAQLLPIEAIVKELKDEHFHSILKIQALLFGVAGLLPSQDPKLLIKDEEIISYTELLERHWNKIRERIGITPMRKEEWKFFRLRPTNFPTRRIAAISYILVRLLKQRFLETFLKIITGMKNDIDVIIDELEDLFICTTDDFWANHYVLDEHEKSPLQPTLLGQDRARDIVINIILPVILSYSDETENGNLRATLLEIFHQYPKMASNQIVREMIAQLQIKNSKYINTAQKQQGLIHLYKMYCRNLECDRCGEKINMK